MKSTPKNSLSPTSIDSKGEKADKTVILSPGKIFFRSFLLALFFVLLLLMLTALTGLSVVYSKFEKFTQAAQISKSDFQQVILTGWKQPIVQSNNHLNLLLLGTDSLSNRGEAVPLTDTIMLISVNLNNGSINTLPLPRDLWSQQYQTKINALLYYGQEKYPDNPEQFSTEVIAELVDLPLHYTLILSLTDLEQLINLMGGVTVNITEGFIDDQFPRSDVDVTIESDPDKLYQTVFFNRGKETMNGERALQYIRSRNSQSDQGSDLARGSRQQQVIQSLFNQLFQPRQWLRQPELAGKLYRFYLDNFNHQLPVEQLIAIGKKLLPYRKDIALKSHSLSVADEENQGVLIHPDKKKYMNQWVYIIENESAFKAEVSDKLLGTPQ